MRTQEYLERFFEEKEIHYDVFEVKHNGKVHLIDNEMIIDLILYRTPLPEQKKIVDILRKIDFANGNVNHFLQHLANAFVKTNSHQ